VRLIGRRRDHSIAEQRRSAEAMGYNQRNDEIRATVERMWRDRQGGRGALATERRLDLAQSTGRHAWF